MQDTRRDQAACFTWKQVALVFLSLALRLADTRLRVVHMALSRRLCRDKAKNGRLDATANVRLFYPKIIISSVLGSKGVVVF
jgi:hypothetical protein